MYHVLLINFEATKRFAYANAKYIFSIVKKNQFQIQQIARGLCEECVRVRGLGKFRGSNPAFVSLGRHGRRSGRKRWSGKKRPTIMRPTVMRPTVMRPTV